MKRRSRTPALRPGPASRMWVALALIAFPQASLAAQEAWQPSREAAPEDVGSIDAIIAAFYDVVSGPAGEKRDWARDSTLYVPGIRFVVVSRSEEGELVARSFDHGTWASGSNDSLERGFHEHEIHRVTRRFGPIADVFSNYEWRTVAIGPIEGRGINSLQLFHDGRRWWITGATWASEEEGTPIPDAYLPD
ncbi:MAG: nuclear transport factor 2 family protein [Gemmatimonadota bacterium]